MSFVTPVIPEPIPFDASLDYNLSFIYYGGNQYSAIEIEIKPESGDTISLAVSNTVATKVLIPANTLTNGSTYVCQVRVGDGAQWSEYSESTIVRCYSPPLLEIDNITNGVVANQTYTFTAAFTQLEGEMLARYRFTLYDSVGNTLVSGDEVIVDLTAESTAPPSHTFSGLTNETYYFVGVVGETEHGMVVASEATGFVARYIQPVMSSSIDLMNDDEGNVRINAILVQLIGNGEEGVDFEYVDGGKIKITPDTGCVYFDEGFDLLDQNYRIQIWASGIREDVLLMRLVFPVGTIDIKYYNNRIHAFKYFNETVGHYMNGEDMTIAESDEVMIALEYVNHAIGITAKFIEAEVATE